MDSNDVRREWAERSGEYSPEYYAYYGPNDTSDLIRRLLERFLDHDAAVLELGCSCGRHLSHLSDHGFDDLTGIEVNSEAADVMEETYPDLAADGTFYFEAIEDVITTFDDNQFDVLYSVQTLQHLHPDLEWVFDELTRVTDELLITVENEDGVDQDADESSVNYINDDFPLYYRDWNRVFTERGCTEVDTNSTDREIVRTFRTAN